jgi:hypothetical protein
VWSAGETIVKRFDVDSLVLDVKLLPHARLLIVTFKGLMVIQLIGYEKGMDLGNERSNR